MPDAQSSAQPDRVLMFEGFSDLRRVQREFEEPKWAHMREKDVPDQRRCRRLERVESVAMTGR
jgi:hypothetical protein